MIDLNAIEKYQLFCLELFKDRLNLSGIDALKEFNEYAVFSFLESGYDVLHTQSLDYVVDQIVDYIERKS